MNLLNLIKIPPAVALAIAALAAYAQPVSNATSNASMRTPDVGASAPSAKAARAANRTLSKQVLKALAHTSHLDPSGIFVKASDGNVTLSGTVTDMAQIPLAVETARRVGGVKSVRDTLRLQDQSY
ncbi:BON domain-containing protein [Paraburkholderia fungorum]|uniref:BON domain-containing protein n=2 Tax=Paraburkholderia TaxID=1822464 RepID=A0A420FK88_9BURK|nr:BON domain-containing protein [Paraburkholderia fungorum]RKF33355.1 hypothetical protein BCY88_09835 [Paraburkholderia fungorum]